MRCKRLREEVREMRLRLEDAEGRATRWARRAGVAESPLSPLLIGHADLGADLLCEL